MATPIALQLYTLRDDTAKDYAGVVRRVAAMGYEGVEPAGFTGTTPQAAGKLFKELGLAVPAVHAFPPPTGAKLTEWLDTLAALGCKRVVSGFGPDQFKTLDLTKHSCDVLNAAYAEISAHGIQLAVHNHWWEYLVVEGQYPYQIMLKTLNPAIQFELDTYWAKTGGVDPAKAVKELGKRAPLLHIKDGPATREADMQAIGECVLDFPGILKASAGNAEWLIVELDRCATDMFVAVEKSVKYLKRIR